MLIFGVHYEVAHARTAGRSMTFALEYQASDILDTQAARRDWATRSA
jgi:hypothetical protein